MAGFFVPFRGQRTSYRQKEVRPMNNQLIHKWYEAYKTGLYRFALSILKDESLASDGPAAVCQRL